MTKGPGLPLGLICQRHVRRQRAVIAIVTAAVILTVASSFVVTAMGIALTGGAVQRVAPLDVPFDAVVLFRDESQASGFQQDLANWQATATVSMIPWARVDFPDGSLLVLGAADPATGDALRPVSPALPSWRYASPATVLGLPGVRMGALFTLAGQAVQAERTRTLGEVEDLAPAYPGAIVITKTSGAALARSASSRAYSVYQVISAGAALMSAAAISCVLAVAFLGRKRSLGILKVLGSTVSDLQRLSLAEAAVMGGAGIPLGLILGFAIATLVYGAAAMAAPCFAAGLAAGAAALLFGAYLPVKLVRNGTCDQLLNNRPVYALNNPSCAKCGLCGGF